MFYASMAIAVLGLVVYQVAVRAAPRAVNPFALLAVVYAIAAVVCVAAAVAWRGVVAAADPMPTRAHLWPAARVSVAVVLIEIGYLLVYRSGWSLSAAPGVAQAVTLAVLFAVGIGWLGEGVTVAKVAGLVLAVAGVVLLARAG